jgi:hypothetical protein
MGICIVGQSLWLPVERSEPKLLTLTLIAVRLTFSIAKALGVVKYPK